MSDADYENETLQDGTDRFVCWSCDGAGEKKRATGVVTECQACNGDGLLSEGTIRRMWRSWRHDEIPEGVSV